MADIRIEIQPKVEPRLRLTPELKVVAELLPLPSIELEEYLQKELEENPFLEWEEEDDSIPLSRIGVDFSLPPSDEETNLSPLSFAKREESFVDFLSFQVRISPEIPSAEKEIVLQLIPLLDEKGFLPESDEEIGERLGLPPEKIRNARRWFSFLEPTGVGSRNLQECLKVQLEQRGAEFSPAYRIVTEGWEFLSEGEVSSLAEKLSLSEKEVQEGLSLLKTLTYAPRERFASSEEIPIEPDLVLIYDEKEGQWRVDLYERPSRKVRYNPYRIRFKDLTPKEKEFLREKIQHARFLIRALTTRELVLLRVGDAILKKQGDLLIKGESSAVPLTMREIARELSLHESTVSRAVQNKYILTPAGILPLKIFFRYGGVGDLTPANLMERIRKIISSENPRKPYSDEEIAQILTQEGFPTARRTVTKYRIMLGIPDSRKRRGEGVLHGVSKRRGGDITDSSTLFHSDGSEGGGEGGDPL